MIYNNFKYLMIHIFLIVISIGILPAFIDSIEKNASDISIQTTLGLIVIFLYLLFGYFSKFRDNAITNLLSFSLVGIIGLIIWIYCYSKSPNDFNIKSSPTGGVWLYYGLYTGGIGFVEIILEKILSRDISGNGLAISIFSLFPTFLFWSGLELRILKIRLLKVK